MSEHAKMLYEWRQHRLALQNSFTEEKLQELMDWFELLDPSIHGFDYDHMDTWPTIWQYITEGYYTKSGNGLGLFYTMVYVDKDPELWLVHDLLHSDIYLITIVDGLVLNRRSGVIEKLDEIIDDLDVLEKHSKDKVMTNVKFN